MKKAEENNENNKNYKMLQITRSNVLLYALLVTPRRITIFYQDGLMKD